MKVFSSSPYATFNSKEWNSLVSKTEKFINTPIKVTKSYSRNFSFKKMGETKVILKKNQLHEQMQLSFS